MNEDQNQQSVPPALSWRVPEWFPNLSADTQSLLRKYFEELVRINKTFSLVTPKTIPFADALHFADCINACQVIRKDFPSTAEVFDFGSGNGFPGLIFGILFPDAKVCLVESDVRKGDVMKELIKTLGLKNARVAAQTVESLPDGSVEFAICRGFNSISKVLLMTRKIVKPAGRIYHLKGDEWSMEVGQIPIQLCALWSPALVGSYKLPIADVNLSVVRTDRVKEV